MAHILIVDDSPTEVHIIQGMLDKHGYQSEAVNNGEDGIEKAKAIRPDLVLMDVVMPGLNGFQATRELSNDPQTADIPVIIVTTKDQETDRIWGLRQGAKDYVTKPIDEDMLIGKIKEILGE
jgi:twitching motility two-component system response regulator PilH